MAKSIKEEVVRMIKLHGHIYFHQNDICRILEQMEKNCSSLSAKSMMQEALRIFSCICDINGDCEEPTDD